MARLFKIKETHEWITDWLNQPNARSALRAVERAAVEQRANFEGARAVNRWPSGMTEKEYGRCVRLIERSLPMFRARIKE